MNLSFAYYLDKQATAEHMQALLAAGNKFTPYIQSIMSLISSSNILPRYAGSLSSLFPWKPFTGDLSLINVLHLREACAGIEILNTIKISNFYTWWFYPRIWAAILTCLSFIHYSQIKIIYRTVGESGLQKLHFLNFFKPYVPGCTIRQI